MTRHRRERIKVAILVATALIVSTAPMWSVRGFLWTIGACGAAVVLYALGVGVETYLGFRRFEKLTAEKLKDLQIRDAARGPRRVYGYLGRDCK
jgi:hypothetical protein